MTNQAVAFYVALLSSLAACFSVPATSSTTACKTGTKPLSWKITDFEWRTGYHVWSYAIGVGPAPPPPPTQFYNCGEAMIRMNITAIGKEEGIDDGPGISREKAVSCVEQTNDAKLANITDMTDYNAGPIPHWFTCDMSKQLFIFPNGTYDPWLDMKRADNLTTQIRMDPVKMTLEVRQTWVCDDDDDGSWGKAEVVGIADIPPLACRGRTSLEPDANFLINSPVMHGPGLNAPLKNGSVCTGPEFFIKAH